MERFCAWCGKYMGQKPPLDDKSATHGMCPRCFKIQMGEVKQNDTATCRECGSTVDLVSNYYWIGGQGNVLLKTCRKCLDINLKASQRACEKLLEVK